MPSEQGFLTGLLVMWMASGDGRYSKSLSTQRPPLLTASGTPSPSKSMVSPSSGKPWSGKASPGLAPLGRVGDGLRSLSRTFHPAAMAILTAASMASGCFRACCKWGSAWTAARNSSLVAADMGGSQSRSDASMVPVATVLGPSVWPKPKPLPQTPRPRMKRAWLRSFLTPRPSTRSMPAALSRDPRWGLHLRGPISATFRTGTAVAAHRHQRLELLRRLNLPQLLQNGVLP